MLRAKISFGLTIFHKNLSFSRPIRPGAFGYPQSQRQRVFNEIIVKVINNEDK
jgi:hypothetical protein